MAADYAGAIAAIKQRFIDNWTATPFGFVNEDDPSMVDADGNPAPWVLFEIVSLGSRINGSGTAGSQVIVYSGSIKAHVFAPTGTGTGETSSGAMQNAIAIGELFRNQLFYNGVTDGCYVRSGYDRNSPPRIEEGDVNSLDGEWFSTTAVIPFEYWHRG